MIRIGRPPRTPWPRRITNWAGRYATNITLALAILTAYSLA